jgi:hypothetical protein
MEKKQPLLTVRPHFDQGLVTVQALLFTAVTFLLVTMIGGTLFYILLHLIGIGRFFNAGHIYGLFLIGSLVVSPPLFFEVKKKAYARTFFRFYEDYLEYQYFQFLISPRRGRVRYRDIDDVMQAGGALQSQRMLTNILIAVPGLNRHPRAFSGLKIEDVPQKLDLMPRILDLIEDSEYRAIARVSAAVAAPAPAPAPDSLPADAAK